MTAPIPLPYRLGRWVLRAALGFAFSRIERFHSECVPRTGPVMFTSNHANSVTDAFVIGASMPRKVNFVATVQLFRLAPLRWLLTLRGSDEPRYWDLVHRAPAYLSTGPHTVRPLEGGDMLLACATAEMAGEVCRNWPADRVGQAVAVHRTKPGRRASATPGYSAKLVARL